MSRDSSHRESAALYSKCLALFPANPPKRHQENIRWETRETRDATLWHFLKERRRARKRVRGMGRGRLHKLLKCRVNGVNNYEMASSSDRKIRDRGIYFIHPGELLGVAVGRKGAYFWFNTTLGRNIVYTKIWRRVLVKILSRERNLLLLWENVVFLLCYGDRLWFVQFCCLIVEWDVIVCSLCVYWNNIFNDVCWWFFLSYKNYCVSCFVIIMWMINYG